MTNAMRLWKNSWQAMRQWLTPRRLTACAILPAVLMSQMPSAVFAQGTVPAQAAAIANRAKVSIPAAAKPASVRTGPHKLQPVIHKLSFSANPSDVELSTARVFQEPLIAMSGSAVPGENKALAAAVLSFKNKNNLEDLSDFTGFIAAFPHSRWRPSLELSMGTLLFRAGYLSQALATWNSAWSLAKNEKGEAQQRVANAALAEIALLNGRLGRKAELQKYVALAAKRKLLGSTEQKIDAAKSGLACMQLKPEKAYKCGPYAINSLLQLTHGSRSLDATVAKTASTSAGTSLAQVKQLSDKVGLKMQMAKRSPGAPMVVPSVVHWKLSHFAAVVGKTKDGKYLLKDPTFGEEDKMAVSQKALDAETDGYCLISQGNLPTGYRAVQDSEGQTIWGKGNIGGPVGFLTPPEWPCPVCSKGGMAQAGVHLMQDTLAIQDTPLSYTPPVGPSIADTVSFNHLTFGQPSSFTFTNLGPDWSFQWLSYLTVDAGTGTATVLLPNGSEEIFVKSGGVYTNSLNSQALLVNMGSGVYQRQLKDGTIQVYSQADTASPPHIFMTQLIDPQNNSVLIQYDANFRITSITDAINQVTTVSYVSNTLGNSGFYVISTITDPFGRSCSFTYDSTNTNLLSITDVIGLKSSFVYDSSTSFITAMTTPYGTTSFLRYVYTFPGPAYGFGLKFTFPDGSHAVSENWDWIYTYYWDRHACELYPNDPANSIYTHSQQILWEAAGDLVQPIESTVKNPLEGLITYSYADLGTVYGGQLSDSGLPAQISQPLGHNVVTGTVGGTKTTGNVLSITVYDAGLPGSTATVNYTVVSADTLPTIATNLAAAVNANASIAAVGVMATVFNDTIILTSTSPFGTSAFQTTYVYSTSGGATETLTLASAAQQVAHFTVGGTITVGDTLYIVLNYPTSAYVPYVVQSGDTLSSVATGLAAAVNGSSSFTSLGITATASGTTVTTVSTCKDSLQLAPYSSGDTETLTLDYTINGSSQRHGYKYNSFGNVTLAADAIGRTFTYTYAANNIDLLQITESLAGDNFLIGKWTYDSNHRPLTYHDASNQETQYTYNASEQLLTITDANSNVTTMTYTGTDTATIGGSKTTGDTVTITVHDAGLSGGQKSKTYTVLSGDTLSSIASALVTAINGDTDLQTIGVSATSASAVITLLSTSANVTSYTESTSGGATETITLGTNTFGYLTKIDGPLSGSNDITTFAYDGYGRLYQTTDSEGYTLTYSYDNANRPTQTTYPDGTTEQTVYDRLDAVLMKDRIGRWNEDSFDSIRQLAFEIDPLGRKTQYTWCTCGSLATLTDPAGQVTTWKHDIEGRPIQKIYADQSQISYSYDPNISRIASKTDALNQVTGYLYQPDNTPLLVSYTNAVNATSPVLYAFDQNFKRLLSVTNGWGTNSYAYNSYIAPSGSPTTGAGRLSTVSNSVISSSDITYTYDVLGRTTNRSINGGSNSTTWTYDAMSRITAEANPLGTFDYAYVDNVGGSSKGTTRLSSITYPNSQVTNFSWYGNTGDQRLQQITNLNPSSAVLSQFTYGYDSAGEITQWQQQQNGNSLNYNLGYDLAGQLTSAQAGGGNTPPAYAKEYYYAYDPASNRTGVQTSSIDTARIGGTVTTSDVVTITVKDSGLSGGTEAVNYTVQVGDTAAKIAVGLATAIDTDSNLQGIGVSAFANGSNEILNIKSASTNVTTYAGSLSGGATETIAFGIFKNGVENASIGGSKTTGDTVTVTVFDPALGGGSEAVTYTVLSGDTIDSIATGVKSAINGDTALSTLGCTATVASNVVSISSTSKNLTTYTESTSSGATETVSLALDINSPEVISIAGTKTTGDVLTVVFVDGGLSGGKESVSYTVLSGDSLSSMTSGLTSAINADTSLQAIGVSATSSGTQATVQSNSPNLTAYRQSTSSGATETIGLTQPLYSWQTATIGGSKTTGNVVTINVFDQALSGGKETVSYTVLSGDTLTSIAAALASAINGDSNLSAIGVSATSNSTVLAIESLSPNVTTYSQSVNSGATETITLGTNTGVIQSAYNNVNELVSQAPGGATRFKATTNKAVKSASVAGQTVTISAAPANPTNFSTSVVGTPTETITVAADPYQSGNATVTIGGTTTAGDTVTITTNNVRLDGVPTSVSYTVKAGDTTSSIAYGLILAIFASSILRYTAGITYSYTSGNTFMLVPIAAYTYYPYGDSNVYTTSVTGVPTETLTMSADLDGNTTATVAGTITVGDQLSLTVQNASLSGGQEVISYTTTGGDTTTSVATALKTAINADTNLQNINLSATSSSGVVTIAAAPTTYTESTSGGATETITLGSSSLGNSSAAIGGTKTTGDTLTITAHNAQLSGGSEAVTYTVLSGDDLVSIAAGLAAAINADTHLQTLGVSASNSSAASLAMSQNFSGNGTMPGGASTAKVSATDAVPNTKTNGYAFSLNSGSGTTLTSDANGNMTQDQAGNTYSWDAENRLIKITYPGSGNYSAFAYDGLGRNVLIQEYTSSSLTSTKQFVWSADDRCEARNASSTITAQYYLYGEMLGSTSYYFTKDHLQSIHEMYSSGLQAQYSYDPFGRLSKIEEAIPSDFGFAGYYYHARSGLSLTGTRPYSCNLGRWISRDEIQEQGGVNLYAYVGQDPTGKSDPSGQQAVTLCICALLALICSGCTNRHNGESQGNGTGTGTGTSTGSAPGTGSEPSTGTTSGTGTQQPVPSCWTPLGNNLYKNQDTGQTISGTDWTGYTDVNTGRTVYTGIDNRLRPQEGDQVAGINNAQGSGDLPTNKPVANKCPQPTKNNKSPNCPPPGHASY